MIHSEWRKSCTMSSSSVRRRPCSRRTVVGAVCLGVLSATSGCLGQLFGMDMPKRNRNVVVENLGDSARNVTVTIDNPDEKHLFRFQYRIKSNATTVAGTFRGPAHTITIHVDESDPRTAEYVPPNGNCDTETIVIEIRDGGAPQIRSHCGGVSGSRTNDTS